MSQPDKSVVRDTKSLRPYLDGARKCIEQGAYQEAYSALHPFRRALLDDTEFWLLYGIALQFVGATSKAETAFRHLRSIAPQDGGVWARHGRLIADRGDVGAARILLMKMAEKLPLPTECLTALARVAEVFGDTSFGMKAYSSILAKSPQHVEALTNLGNLQKKHGALSEAEKSYKAGLAINPRSAILHRNLSDLLARTLRNEEAIKEMEHCITLAPDNPHFMSDLIFAQHYSSRFTAENLAHSARLWGQRFGDHEKIERKATGDVNKRQLRIGLLSGSFRQHPVGFLALPGLEKLDPERFSIFCYANQLDSDAFTERFKSLSDRWRPVAYLSDAQLELLILNDRIDILIEMSGHAAGNRLPVVAKRVAPVQVKWVGGQFNTTGIEAMDFFLSDEVETPSDDDKRYVEEIIRLPGVYASYDPPENAPRVSSLPAAKTGHVTFGSLNKVNKLNGETIALWSRCLKGIPDSRLILKGDSFDHAETVQKTKSLFARHDIDENRIECQGFTPHPDLLSAYHDIDIALDPHPYSGCLTTCEALWMGVPVVTLPGPTFAGRHSASFLTAVGLTDWIAADQDDFMRLVTEKSKDLDSLSSLRGGLRDTMAKSPLCDAERFSAHLTDALFTMWDRKQSQFLSAEN